MKKLLALLLVFVMLFSLFACKEEPPTPSGDGTAGGETANGGEGDVSPSDTPSAPEANPASDFEYIKNDDNTITIMGYLGTSKNVVIPETIEGLSVTILGYRSFSFSDIESIAIPDSVYMIAVKAFLGCEKLKTVDFGEGVTQILESAFEGCTALEKAILPPKLETIGAMAFWKCSALKEVFIPKNLKNWASSASYGIFSDCTALHTISIEDGLEVLGGQYGTFSRAIALKTLVIPASVKKIADNAFHATTSLESVTFLGDAPQVKANVFGVSGEGSQTVSQKLIIYFDPNTNGWDDTSLRQYSLVPIE